MPNIKKNSRNIKIKKRTDYTSMMIGTLSVAVIVVVLFLSYLSKTSKSPVLSDVTDMSQTGEIGNNYGNNSMQASMEALSMTQSITQHNSASTQIPTITTLEKGAVPANGRVVFKIDHFQKLALQPLEFQVFDPKNKALTPLDLKIVDQSKMRMIVVGANLRDFSHVNPSFSKGK